MADVFFSNGGLAPMQTNHKQSIPVGTHSVPVVAAAAPLPPPIPKTTSLIKTARSHKVTIVNGKLTGPDLE